MGGHSFLGKCVRRTMFPRNNCPAGQLILFGGGGGGGGGGARVPITSVQVRTLPKRMGSIDRSGLRYI